MGPVSSRRIAIAHALDAFFFVLLVAAVVIDVTGGIRIGRDWYRISATDPSHTVLLAAAALAVRHVILPRPSIRHRLAARRARRTGDGAATESFTLTAGAPVAGSLPTRRDWLIAAAVMAVATAWVMQDQLRDLTGVPDRGDPFFSMWRL